MSVVSRYCIAAAWRARAWRAILSARGDSLRRLRAAGPRRVLVICYGNIYRSAFVEHDLRSLVGPGVEVRSGGFHAVGGRLAPERHIEISRGYGVDLSSHRSSVVVDTDLQWADVVVLMDRRNWVRLMQRGGDPEKVVWLGALVPGPLEIEDPYELDDDALRSLLKRLRACTKRLAAELATHRGGPDKEASAASQPAA